MRRAIPVFFDFACPWSYTARAREARLARETGLRFQYLPWDLDPTVPNEGTRNPYPEADDHLLAYAEAAGVALRIPRWRPSTRRALLGVPYAAAHGKEEAYVDAGFRAYWERHDDLHDDRTLARIAREAGLDPQGLLASIDDGGGWEAYLHAVDALGEKLDVETTVTYVLPEGGTYVGLGTYDELKARLAGMRGEAEGDEVAA